MKDSAKTACNYAKKIMGYYLESLLLGDIELDELRERLVGLDCPINVRSDWHELGIEPDPEEYRIVLAWGGPSVRIVGNLNEYKEPETAYLQHQDWGEPWKEYFIEDENWESALLWFVSCFYFGE